MFRTDEGLTVSWTNWKGGEPNNPPAEKPQDCVVRRKTGVWTDTPCTDARKYYCEGNGSKLKNRRILHLTILSQVQKLTRMHSNRMRTVRFSGRRGRVSAQGGDVCPGWGCLSRMGVSDRGKGCLSRGCLPKEVSAKGGCLPWGCLPGGVYQGVSM